MCVVIIFPFPDLYPKANDLNELKKLQKPSDVIKLIFDCVGLLKMERVQPVQGDEITLGIGKEKQTLPFLKVTNEAKPLSTTKDYIRGVPFSRCLSSSIRERRVS